MSCWCGIEDNHGVFHWFHMPKQSIHRPRNGIWCINMMSSYPQLHYALHNFGKSHCFVYTRYSEGQILHHPPHHPTAIRFIQQRIISRDGRYETTQRTLLYHFLQGAAGVDFHSIEVVKTIHARCVFGEFLTKCIRQIMCWISWLCHYNTWTHELVRYPNDIQ